MRIVQTARYTTVTMLLVAGVSWTRAVVRSEDPLADTTVTWARDHGLGRVVDLAEHLAYRHPPSARPAEQLSLSEENIEQPPGATATVAPSRSMLRDAERLEHQAPHTPTLRWRPEALVVQVRPALRDEGIWRPAGSTGGEPVVWVSSLRPLETHGSVTASVAVFDQDRLVGAMFNGRGTPGNTARFVLREKIPTELLGSARVAFNGGFRFEHTPGSGYVTESRVLRAPGRGQATIVVDAQGRLNVGVWGEDLDPKGSYVSVRQNLKPVVRDGVNRGTKAFGWGTDEGGVKYVLRSALCKRRDGKLMYAMVGKVDAQMLGDALVKMGCVVGIQLDINGSWPSLFTFARKRDGARPVSLDRRVSKETLNRYLRGSSKDFFVLFDPASLPKRSVIDAYLATAPR